MLNSNQKRPKSTVIRWSDQQKFYFKKVKAALGKKTALSYPIPYAETFCLQTQVILVLLPLFTNLIPVESCVCRLPFFSKKLSKAQFKYAMFDKEVLAIYESVKFFRHMYHTLGQSSCSSEFDKEKK